MGRRLGTFSQYFIAVAFVASGFSANLRGLVSPLGIVLPKALSNPFGADGGVIDIIVAVVIIITAIILSRGMTEADVENVLVILKVFAIVLFIIVGLTAIQASNYVPFIPEHKVTENGDFGGWQGIYVGFL